MRHAHGYTRSRGVPFCMLSFKRRGPRDVTICRQQRLAEVNFGSRLTLSPTWRDRRGTRSFEMRLSAAKLKFAALLRCRARRSGVCAGALGLWRRSWHPPLGVDEACSTRKVQRSTTWDASCPRYRACQGRLGLLYWNVGAAGNFG